MRIQRHLDKRVKKRGDIPSETCKFFFLLWDFVRSYRRCQKIFFRARCSDHFKTGTRYATHRNDHVLLCGGGLEIVRGPIKIALYSFFPFFPFHVSQSKYGSSVDSQIFPSPLVFLSVGIQYCDLYSGTFSAFFLLFPQDAHKPASKR